MDRREFLIEAGKAFPILAGATYFIACGGGSDSTSTMTEVVVGTSTVVQGHSHTARVPRTDLDPPQNDHSYISSSSSGHTHVVILTAIDLTTLAGGGAVVVTSAISDGHMHDFTFRR